MPYITGQLYKEHFVQMEALEKRFYSSEYITPAEASYEYYAGYPRSTVAAIDGSEVAGFINMFPVVDDIFQALMRGSFNDSSLTLDAIQYESRGGTPLHMFLSCIAVDTVYRKQGLTGALLLASIESYSDLSERCDFLAADAVTPEGCRFLQRLGLGFICNSDHGSRVFASPYDEFLKNAALLYKK